MLLILDFYGTRIIETMHIELVDIGMIQRLQ